MLLQKLSRLLISFAFLISCFVEASDQQHLQPSDVVKIMKQILNQHIEKKEISNSILRKSFKVYIDQFDPERVYLLESDVNPFLQISDSTMNQIMNQYQQSKFSEYAGLNDVIQKSILRSRQIRSDLLQQYQVLFKESDTYLSDGHEGWRDPDLKREFAVSEVDLKARIKHAILQFIASERKRYGDSFVNNHQNQTLRIFERQAKIHENQYLFLNENGQPMSDTEKQNLFILHILKALASSLDAHTTVLDSTEAFDMRIRLEKEIRGVGIVLQPTSDGNFTISQVIEGGPAAKSGLIKPGDILLKVDDTSLKDLSHSAVMDMIRGKVGTKVTLQVRHPSDNSINSVELIRKEISINEDRAISSYETFGNGIIGKIKLDSFYQGENGDISAETDVKNAIKNLDRKGDLRGLILDLRENSGGFLSQAVKVAGLFITNGVIVISKYFNGNEHIYRDVDGKVAYDGPLIILTSKATASAAEIVAQALQDYGVAIIVGDEQTYGKGTIQSQTVTENQATTYFKVTVGKYYTVSGKTPQIRGVKADIVVPSEFTHENIGEEYLDYPLTQDTIPDAYNDKLEDIAPNLKSWYLHYYVPTLQHKKLMWQNLLPNLKKNSSYRIAHNKNYQMFLKGTNQEDIAKAWSQDRSFGSDDLQMSEAINIIKDMIVLHAQARDTDFQNSKRAGVDH